MSWNEAELRARLATRWLARELVLLSTTGSTNDQALALARAGAATGTAVIAERQTGGRGRQGRAWHTLPGENLYVSVILRPEGPPQHVPPLTLAAGVAVCDAVNAVGFCASIKWPNDVLIEDRKVAGVLTETTTRGDRLDAVVVGIGVNVNAPALPAEIAGLATSLRIARGADVDRAAFTADLLGRLEVGIETHARHGAAPIVRAWKDRTRSLGRRVMVPVDGVAVVGRARDLDDDGALVVELEDGRELHVVSGEVTLIP